ncbi:MAG: hypothetical protein HZC29_01070 [Thaumarchaeota archaeon]|nr:hypothetical protein [Nitrososphaerota archaeon]
MSISPIILSVMVLVGLFGNAQALEYSVQQIQSKHISELSLKASDVVELCQYAETKFEKKWCHKNALEIKKDWAFQKLTKSKQTTINQIIENLTPEFKK